MSLERENGRGKTLDDIKSYFVDPNNPEVAEDLA